MSHADTPPEGTPRKQRGGARPGSGLKAADGAQGPRRINLMLDEATLAVFRALGGGNASLGARAAARLAAGGTGQQALAAASPPVDAGQHRGAAPGGV